MKCTACNHEHDWEVEGSEKFVEIVLSNDIEFIVYSGMGNHEEIKLYACPKCSTVRMEKW